MLFWQWIKKRLEKKEPEDHLYKNPDLEKFLMELLGEMPKNIKVYEEAFIHRSAQVKDKEGNDINFERLEFLGDAVLGLIVAEYIFEKSPNKQEGYLTKMRSKIVSRKKLNEIGKKMKLVGKLHPDVNPNLGEDINGNLVEALIGAVYEDGGFKFAKEFVYNSIIDKHIDFHELENMISSYKSLILEWGQKTKNNLNFNTFEEENAEDFTVFISVLRLNDKVISKGRGSSKKRAEENASRSAYHSMQDLIQTVN